MLKLTVETTDELIEDFEVQEGVDRYFVKDRVLVVKVHNQYNNYPFETLRCYRVEKQIQGTNGAS